MEDMDTSSSDIAGGPRGIKRKAEESSPLSHSSRRIQALSQDVVNKIAAGEIIVAPVHALKELIENAVDAGSTSLEILVKDGGLKLLQIADNGSGINRDDLSILCERFTTSKLKNFEDLTSIGTYGFRGEALASISHIAHLSVTTKTADSSCAWKAQYAGGSLVPSKPGQSSDPKPCAGRQGTQITVEDLFYNIPTRRRAFRSASEEYAKILDLVGRYAIHCSGVAFSCKKHGDSALGISIPANASTHDRIRQIYGSTVATELLSLEISNDRWGFKSQGWISSLNYNAKRILLLLFINHRSVESTNIRKAVEQTYSAFLAKGSHPFVYLSLDIDPARVDVNVHPTKREVNFLNEDEIIEIICDDIKAVLGRVDTSRTFITQSLLPGAPKPSASKAHDNEPGGASIASRKSYTHKPASTPVIPKQYDNNLVRTDSRVRKITTMLPPALITAPSGGKFRPMSDDMDYGYVEKEPTLCRLTSIKELRAEVRESMHNELTNVFASHTFIGIVDEQRRIAAIQGGVKLFLIDYGMTCNEYFYQVGLTDFGNFGCIKFDPPLRLHDILAIAASQEQNTNKTDDDLDWDEVVSMVESQLISRKEMLAEYFSMELTEGGDLLTLPLLMKGYLPSLAKLPQFLLRLGPHVDWVNEKNCFHTFLRELASFYVPEPVPNLLSRAVVTGAEEGQTIEEDQEIVSRRDELGRVIEHIIFPALKARLVATTGLLKGVTEIADLKGLYKVFERC